MAGIEIRLWRLSTVVLLLLHWASIPETLCCFYRLFLRKLKMELKIPVLALVDADPYGLKILSVYMKGVSEGSEIRSVTDALPFRHSNHITS
jgi:hypothetical protein